jgi:hypothetical protein
MMTDTVEDLFRLQVAHGLEKSTLLKDPGGWPDYQEISDYIDRMDKTEFLLYLSIAIEDRLRNLE